MSDAVCTIASRNYLPSARILIESARRQNPDLRAFVLLVDDARSIDDAGEPFTIVPVENLNIPNFRSIAFKYDILELNTAVKASFCKYLLQHENVHRLIYFDPDVSVYDSIAPLFELLSEYSILLTPHTMRPIDDEKRPNERDFLRAGIFNLGFVGLRNCPATDEFLRWWAERCLQLGFQDVENGLCLDQKWMNLAPCFFDGVQILKHLGCNVAYFNLHERRLLQEGGRWHVAPDWPLIFFHFSGIVIEDQQGISKHTNRFTVGSRPDVAELLATYRNRLLDARKADPTHDVPYAWGTLSNGAPINKLCRVVYSLNESSFCGTDPFDANGEFYKVAKAKRLLSENDTVSHYTSTTTNFNDPRLRLLHWAFRAALWLFGADKYTLLSKYLSHVSILRNQGLLFRDVKGSRNPGICETDVKAEDRSETQHSPHTPGVDLRSR